MTDLHKTIVKELLLACKEAVERAALDEPVYSLVIAWSPGQSSSMPPVFGIGTERERSAVLAEPSDDMKWLLWNPAEFENYDSEELELSSEALDEACGELNAEMNNAASWAAATVILDTVAQELGQHDWGESLQRTEDFIAYATDYDLSDCTRSIRACASAHTVAGFEAKGWLI